MTLLRFTPHATAAADDRTGGYVDALDSGSPPILYARFRSTFSRPEFDRFAAWHVEQLEAALRAKRKVISISDLRLAEGSPHAGDRKHMAAWMERTAELNRTACALGILITGNPLHTGIIRALHWISPPQSAVTVVSTLDDGWRVAVDTGRSLGLAVLRPAAWPPLLTLDRAG